MPTIAEELAKLPVADSFVRKAVEVEPKDVWQRMAPGSHAGLADTTEGLRAQGLFGEGDDGVVFNNGAPLSVGGSVTNVAAIIELSKVPVTNERSGGIWLCRDGVDPVNTQSGYYLRAERVSSTVHKYRLEKWVKGEITLLNSAESSSYAAVGARIALVVGEGKVRMFASATPTGSFTEVVSAADSTYTAGYPGVMYRGRSEFKLKNFCFGALPYSGSVNKELNALTLFDSFERNESPLGAPWALMTPAGATGKSVLTQGWTPQRLFEAGIDGAYWPSAQFAVATGKRVAAVARIEQANWSGANNERFGGFWLCRATPTGAESGYFLRIEKEGTKNIVHLKLERWTAGSVNVLAEIQSEGTALYAEGVEIALVVGSGRIEFWRKQPGGEFVLFKRATDSTYTEGYTGLMGRGEGETGVNNFKAGVIAYADEGEEPAAEKTVQVLKNGSLVKAKRWVLKNGSLVNA